MGSVLRTIGVVVEALSAFVLLATSWLIDDRIPTRYLAVGFAAGFVYRHVRSVSECRHLRESPVRSLSVSLAWTALGVAIDRSIEKGAARRALGSGIALGSVGYWVVSDDG